MKVTQNSGNYQNAYEKHEERKRKLKQLTEKAQYEALLRLASQLGISAEDLLRILAGVQGIDPKLGRRIEYLWAIEFGKVKIEVPKPPEIVGPGLPEVEIRKGTAFTRLTGLEDKNTVYEAIQTKIVESYKESCLFIP